MDGSSEWRRSEDVEHMRGYTVRDGRTLGFLARCSLGRIHAFSYLLVKFSYGGLFACITRNGKDLKEV